MNYNELNQKLTGRNKASRKVANHTYLLRIDDKGRPFADSPTIGLKLHNTVVVTFYQDGSVKLNSGGYHTSTTKDRINLAIGNKLSQRNGVWYIGGKRFQDGMIIRPDGSITGDVADTLKEDKKLKARVKKFVELCANSIPIPEPSAGDCWYCHMVTTDKQSLGDASKNTEHLFSHMDEGYVVPSLVLNALREGGAGDLILAYTFNPNAHPNGQATARQYVKRLVRRYMLKRFGYAV